MKIYKITEASEYLGVSINTLKTLANNGKIKSFKTTGEHRRFRQEDLDAYMGVKKEKQERLTVIYARCSTAKQKENLERQIIGNSGNDRRNLKQDALNAYGGKCACCGIDNYEFMAIDHINGGGNKHRRDNKTGAGLQFYRWLKKNKYPKAFRVLCHNCNVSYGLYGYCPHTSPSKYGSNAYKDEIQKNKNK